MKKLHWLNFYLAFDFEQDSMMVMVCVKWFNDLWKLKFTIAIHKSMVHCKGQLKQRVAIFLDTF